MLWAGRREVLHTTALSSGGPQSVALLFLLPALMGMGVVQSEKSSESKQYFLLSLSLLLVERTGGK